MAATLFGNGLNLFNHTSIAGGGGGAVYHVRLISLRRFSFQTSLRRKDYLVLEVAGPLQLYSNLKILQEKGVSVSGAILTKGCFNWEDGTVKI